MPPNLRAAIVAAGAGLLLASCGSGARGTPAASATPTPAPVTPARLVTPPAPSVVTQLTLGELEDLARAHRILTAALSQAAVSGAMVSDIAPQQQYSAPLPASSAAVNQLIAVLKQGGATVTGGPPGRRG